MCTNHYPKYVLRIVLALAMLIAASACMFASSRRDCGTAPICGPQNGKFFSLGTTHSLKGVGICADWGHDPNAFSAFAFTADLIDILTGISSTPGLKFTYHYNSVLSNMEDGKYVVYAGPGLTGGHVRNTDNHSGFMGGISFDAGLRVRCLRSVVVSVELQADLSLIFKNKFNPAMSLYKAGFEQSYFPHVRIQYEF